MKHAEYVNERGAQSSLCCDEEGEQIIYTNIYSMFSCSNTHAHFRQACKDNHLKGTHTHTHTEREKSDLQVYSMSVFTRIHQTGLSHQQGARWGSDSPTGSDDTHTPTSCACVTVCVSRSVCACCHHLIWVKELPHGKAGLANDWMFGKAGEGGVWEVWRECVVGGRARTRTHTHLFRGSRGGRDGWRKTGCIRWCKKLQSVNRFKK